MKESTIDNTYVITYTNHLFFGGKTLAFRKKELFDITGIPSLINRSEQGWWIGRKLLTPTKAQELIIPKCIEVDVSELQWYQQEQLNHVFNL